MFCFVCCPSLLEDLSSPMNLVIVLKDHSCSVAVGTLKPNLNHNLSSPLSHASNKNSESLSGSTLLVYIVG